MGKIMTNEEVQDIIEKWADKQEIEHTVRKLEDVLKDDEEE